MILDDKHFEGVDLTIKAEGEHLVVEGHGSVMGTVAALAQALVSMLTDENLDDDFAAALLGGTVELLTNECCKKRGGEFSDTYRELLLERMAELDDDDIRDQYTVSPIS